MQKGFFEISTVNCLCRQRLDEIKVLLKEDFWIIIVEEINGYAGKNLLYCTS